MEQDSTGKWEGTISGKKTPIFLTVILLGVLTGASVAHGEGKRLVPDTERKIIVLDPGHGGNDSGARGSGGSQEKDVTLAVARALPHCVARSNADLSRVPARPTIRRHEAFS